jgi:hypothetical protein
MNMNSRLESLKHLRISTVSAVVRRVASSVNCMCEQRQWSNKLSYRDPVLASGVIVRPSLL